MERCLRKVLREHQFLCSGLPGRVESAMSGAGRDPLDRNLHWYEMTEESGRGEVAGSRGIGVWKHGTYTRMRLRGRARAVTQ